MVYKRYIKKRGKVYGPYYYESKRVGDKVIGNYIGKFDKEEKSKFLIHAFIFLLAFTLLSFFVFNFVYPFTGKVIFSSGNFKREVNVVVNVKSDNFLFDILVFIPENMGKVAKGDKVKVHINLTEISSGSNINVNAKYIIKDYNGKVYYEENESFSVQNSKSYVKTFSTDKLSPGKYIIGVELTYKGAFATSSAQFEVIEGLIEKRSNIIFNIILVALGAVILGVLAALIQMIISRRKIARFKQILKASQETAEEHFKSF